MLKQSGKVKLITNVFSKLVFSVLFAAAIIVSIVFMKYKLVYHVQVNGEDAGYASSKIALEKEIDNYVINGDSENVGYVILNSTLDYELMLVSKDMQTSEDAILAKVKEDADVYYRVYAVIVDDEQKGIASSLEEAQKIVDSVNEKQSEYKEKAKLEIEEKYLQEYETIEDVEVAVNTIYEPIKKANDLIKVVKSTPAAAETVSDEVLLALKQNLTELDFNVPVANPVITSRFGWRSSGYHYGIDLAVPTGTPVYAAESGVVTYSGWMGAYGYLIIIQHASGYETRYGHCSRLLAEVGDEVAQGDLIAEAGSTGRSTGPHVHMEIRFEGTALNPEVFLYD